MEKKIVCEFTKRELEALYSDLFRHYVGPALFADWESARAEIKRKLNPHDPTISGTSSWPSQ